MTFRLGERQAVRSWRESLQCGARGAFDKPGEEGPVGRGHLQLAVSSPGINTNSSIQVPCRHANRDLPMDQRERLEEMQTIDSSASRPHRLTNVCG